MLLRGIAEVARRRLAEYPAACLVGPRQSGKTTLARSFVGLYFDLEQETDRLRLDVQWHGLVSGKALVVLDEVQASPEVFARLRGAIDRDRRRTGRFLLLGSVSPTLMTHVSESLVGRLSLVELTPFRWNELPAKAARHRLWFYGGYPEGGAIHPARYPRWQHDYLALVADRDLPNWGLPAKPEVTRRLLKMLAAVHGQVWNASQIGQSLGISYHTVNTYLDYLAGAFLIRRLAPYHANLTKRLVKSPKVYWRDSGLLHATLHVVNPEHLLAQPWVGASFEGFVIEQLLGALQQADRPFEAFYLRTSDLHEIDVVLDLGKRLWAVEIKLTSSPSPDDMRRLDFAAHLIRADQRILVSTTRESTAARGRVSCNLEWLLAHLDRLLRE